jgi:hypothetical protein
VQLVSGSVKTVHTVLANCGKVALCHVSNTGNEVSTKHFG